MRTFIEKFEELSVSEKKHNPRQFDNVDAQLIYTALSQIVDRRITSHIEGGADFFLEDAFTLAYCESLLRGDLPPDVSRPLCNSIHTALAVLEQDRTGQDKVESLRDIYTVIVDLYTYCALSECNIIFLENDVRAAAKLICG